MRIKRKLATIIMLLLILISLMFSAYTYLSIKEDKIATHWNSEGQIDNYMLKLNGVLIFPLILLIIFSIFLFAPKIKFLKFYIEYFKNAYNLSFIIMAIFITYLHVLTMIANINPDFNILNFI